MVVGVDGKGLMFWEMHMGKGWMGRVMSGDIEAVGVAVLPAGTQGRRLANRRKKEYWRPRSHVVNVLERGTSSTDIYI